MGAITLTRKVYEEGLTAIEKAVSSDVSYLDQFKFEFPDGINTANTIEICRAINNPDFDSKIKITKICIAGKNVICTRPNGQKMSFCLSSPADSFEGFDLFREEPLTLSALTDVIYGYLLKKSIQPSPARETALSVEK